MASYTVMIVPLRSNINSLDALRFFLWVKKLQELEREKDILWMSLQTLEQARHWIRSRLEGNAKSGKMEEVIGVSMNTVMRLCCHTEH
ncbi:suppressor APC domain-containing protein 1 isoform X1 [Pangasianodon hypophthalmus]|uniref:suppressor APC domain-containing protein 1 isoform X1 n=1 Tax=Pangasianodon hypophthalmus TaxID=310915 RepID=UPI002306E1D0|nr:suppressor APC domain-containing protein 1 isoform X1 [Pangasianodon hypophthalmus]